MLRPHHCFICLDFVFIFAFGFFGSHCIRIQISETSGNYVMGILGGAFVLFDLLLISKVTFCCKNNVKKLCRCKNNHGNWSQVRQIKYIVNNIYRYTFKSW